MPNDFVTLKALTDELNSILKGGKLAKICQPEKDELMFSIRNRGENYLLVISANPCNPRIHLTTKKKENPYCAPPMAMMLRKYLTSASIEDISMQAEDRIVDITLKGRNEMLDEKRYHIIAEMMGRYSNVIITESDYRIMDALYRITPDEKQLRCILTGALYAPPPQAKIKLNDTANIHSFFEKNSECITEEIIAKNIGGMAPATIKQLLHLSNVQNNQKLSQSDVDNIILNLNMLTNIYKTPFFKPCFGSDGSGKTTDYYIMPYFDKSAYVYATTLNECADTLYSEKDAASRINTKGKRLETSIKNALKKTAKNIEIAQNKLAECDEMEDIRIEAELLTCNLYNIPKLADKTEVFNYYTDETQTINLDKTVSPHTYAQKLYKKYAKLKRAKEICAVQLSQNLTQLDYLNSIKSSLNLATDVDELKYIEEELVSASLIKRQNAAKSDKNNKILYAEYTVEGFTVLRGKNNLQNDKITFKEGRELDVWLHAAKAHGSHIIIFSSRQEVPESTIKIVAEIAAYFSEMRGNCNINVDYALRKFVRRHPSGKPGLVTYTDYSTISVQPNPHTELLKS